ncbi:hypothetical protein SLEP1_g21465 [Rubroshorea leprosula]|uniref:Legume-specific protein n=1 Tax=Rubroshorea leprosula TaxID=152421 RepID=A0AAV5JFA0_9ROSI|nr:hypothetical protein SLEP1_g21465 [Rubroshorea leprosula]
MEGLIPFVYRAIVQYRNGKEEGLMASWFKESPSASYMRLPGDSGRFQISEGFSTSSPCSMAPPNSSTAQIIVSTGIQTPVHRLTSRRLVA